MCVFGVITFVFACCLVWFYDWRVWLITLSVVCCYWLVFVILGGFEVCAGVLLVCCCDYCWFCCCLVVSFGLFVLVFCLFIYELNYFDMVCCYYFGVLFGVLWFCDLVVWLFMFAWFGCWRAVWFALLCLLIGWVCLFMLVLGFAWCCLLVLVLIGAVSCEFVVFDFVVWVCVSGLSLGFWWVWVWGWFCVIVVVFGGWDLRWCV